jgi:gamma-glutamylcyclotransferase (GGCT)/AIG2-like uncharacterized protein YtfP
MGSLCKIFVYGTLKRTFPANTLLGTDAKFLGVDTVPGILIPLTGFPAFIPSNLCEVYGEVFEIAEERITRLDNYEGVHVHLYKRKSHKGAYGDMFYYEYCNKPTVTDTMLVVKEGRWTHESPRLLSALCSYKELCKYWEQIKGEIAEVTMALTPPNPLMTPQDRATDTPPWENTRMMLERIYGKPIADRTLPAVCPIPEPENVPLAVPAVGKF